MSISIKLNGRTMELPDGSSLYDLILLKKWRHVRMHIRIDESEIRKSSYSTTLLKEGQDIKIIPQFGGG